MPAPVMLSGGHGSSAALAPGPPPRVPAPFAYSPPGTSSASSATASPAISAAGGGGGAGHMSLQDFKLLYVIGRGSYAKVLQVEHVRTGKVYAMKVIKKELVQDEEDIDWVHSILVHHISD